MIPPPIDWKGSLPGISVLCPTYGRAARLPGLVQSFLCQDYQGAAELIILNDRHDQTFTIGGTSRLVHIENLPEQFATLGEKRNRLVEMAHYPYVAWWDDDDRYLPQRLTRGVQLLRQGYRGSIEVWIWANDGKSLKLTRPRSPFCTALMEKQAILDAGGFPPQQMHQDLALVGVMVHKLHAFFAESDTGFPTSIYRLPGTSDHTHVGEFDRPTASAEARAYMQGTVDQRVALGKEPTGVIEIVPKWGVDYVALADAAWAAQQGKQGAP